MGYATEGIQRHCSLKGVRGGEEMEEKAERKKDRGV